MKLSYSVILLAAFASLQAYAAPGSSSCISGSAGLSKGDGYKGYCCETNDDCYESCISGVCNGASKPTTTTKPITTTKPTTTSSTPGEPTPKCLPGSYGLGNGDGYKGDCCKNSDDCRNACVSGICNGAASPGAPGPCKKGYQGLGNGKGPVDACCDDSDDCQEACVRGRCTAP